MTHPIAAAIDRFLVLVRQATAETADHGKLITSLDELAWLAHSVKDEFDETEYDDPPESDSRATFLIARTWLPSDIEGDIEAVEDLSGILDDLEEIRWRFDRTSEADALFHFKLGFQSHWGHHLRSLQKIIHEWYW